jgi:hypothetical protein
LLLLLLMMTRCGKLMSGMHSSSSTSSSEVRSGGGGGRRRRGKSGRTNGRRIRQIHHVPLSLHGNSSDLALDPRVRRRRQNGLLTAKLGSIGRGRSVSAEAADAAFRRRAVLMGTRNVRTG